jgi:hypothetical protein
MNKSSISQHKALISKVVAGGLITSYLASPEATEIGLASVAAAGVTWCGYQSTDWIITFRHRREWVEPLHLALAPAIGVEASETKARSYLKVPRHYQVKEGKIMKICLPKEYAGQNNTAIESILRAKLDLRDATITISSKGRKPFVEVRRKHNPPKSAPFSAWVEEIASATESAPIIGVGPQKKLVTVDLDGESPHVLMAAGTGGGKSETKKNIVAQLMRHGAQLVVLDPKRHSHKWAKGLPMVDYYRDTEDIHNALVALGEIGTDRTRLTDEEDEPDLRRILVLVEEANTLLPRLSKYWSENKPKGAPKTSPAIAALGEIMFMGRTARMNVLMLAQSGTVRALGGPEIRENFATRILARHTMNAWRMLVPEAPFVPKVSIKGRLAVVKGATVERVQGFYWTDQEARDWIMGGSPATEPAIGRHAVTLSHNAVRAFLTSADGRDVTGGVTPHLALVKEEEPRYSLAAAAREGIVPMTDAALRQAKKRDPEFPKGLDGQFTADELRRWYSSRSVKTA